MHEINKRGRVPNLPEGTPSSHDAAIGNSAAPEPSLLDTFRHGLTAAVIGASLVSADVVEFRRLSAV
jgi:hypothetical protein